MNIIIIFLCALAEKATSETEGVFPAKILADQKTISEGSDLYLTCSTFGLKKQVEVNVHLCKNGFGIRKKKQKQDQIDTRFNIKRVGLSHAGNYSCVYSRSNASLCTVAMTGHSFIQIVVIANFLPADISVAGSSTVSEGDVVEFRCTVSDTLQTLGECQLIYSYLRKDESTLQVQAFNIKQMEANFTIESAALRDSGNYSCVVLPSKCVQGHEMTLLGNNAVLLKVKGSMLLWVTVPFAAISLILFLGLGLWWIKKQSQIIRDKSKGSSYSPSSKEKSQQANTNMLEEQEEQTGVDSEADGEFSSTDEEESCQNHAAAVDSTPNDNSEDLYSVVDDPPAEPASTATYAVSLKRKKTLAQVLT